MLKNSFYKCLLVNDDTSKKLTPMRSKNQVVLSLKNHKLHMLRSTLYVQYLDETKIICLSVLKFRGNSLSNVIFLVIRNLNRVKPGGTYPNKNLKFMSDRSFFLQHVNRKLSLNWEAFRICCKNLYDKSRYMFQMYTIFSSFIVDFKRLLWE